MHFLKNLQTSESRQVGMHDFTQRKSQSQNSNKVSTQVGTYLHSE